MWQTSICQLCISTVIFITARTTNGHRGGGGGGWGGHGQGHHGNQGHHNGWGGGGNGIPWNGYQPTQFGGGGWIPNSQPQSHQQPLYYSPTHNNAPIAQQLPVHTPHVNQECPRPQFTDGIAQLILEKCDTEAFHKACWDSSSPIHHSWKVKMLCPKGKVRIKHTSTCSNGEWNPPIPTSCAPVFERYSKLAEEALTDKFGKVPFSKPSPQESAEYTDPIVEIKPQEKQCPMIRMKLTENFIFSCFMHHQSSSETVDCINHPRVHSGTVAQLKCKPPYYNLAGSYSEWICDNGAWEGNFNENLKCHYSNDPIKLKPSLRAQPAVKATTTSTTTPRSTTSPPTKRTTPSPTTESVYGWITTVPIIPQGNWEPSSTNDVQNPPVFETLPKPSTTTTRRPTTSKTTTTTTRPTTTTTTTTTRKTTTRRTTTTTSTPSPFIDSTQDIKCPPLKPRSVGMILECVSRTKATLKLSEQVFVNGCDIPQPVGAEAKYSCTKFFEATGGLVNIYRKCKEDGTWAGSAENFNCAPECGRKNEVFVPLITFGSASFRSEWPWHAAVFLRENSGDDWQYICGGTLITKRTIMTAAHCLTFPESSRVRNVSSFKFDLGRYELDNVDDIVQTREVESVHIHSSYSPFGYDSDIGIVILKDIIDIGYHVRPICFPQSINTAQEEVMLAEGSVGTVIGWGLTEQGKLADSLQTAQLRVVGPIECAAGTRSVGGGRLQIRSTTYCAAPGGRNGTTSIEKIVNVCNGDSGGGMYFPSKSSDSDSSRWFLQGIVSVGIGDENNKCKPNQYSFFTRVGRYADWMIRVMSENDAL